MSTTAAAPDARLLRLGEDVVGQGTDLDDLTPAALKKAESWLAALLQMEHVNLLIGNGLSMAIGFPIGVTPPTMTQTLVAGQHTSAISEHAKRTAKAAGRGSSNLEDEIRSALALIDGFKVLARANDAEEVEAAVNTAMKSFISQVLSFERGVRDKHQAADRETLSQAILLQRFLLPFAARAAGRDRLHLFTTNYDRLLEFTADLLGLRLLDRFVGTLKPTFSASRLDLDMHYAPPGVRGEPRLLEGVVRYAKLHGSVDWRNEHRKVVKVPLQFGAEPSDPSFPLTPSQTTVIYPNPAKDVETLSYPYSELFRDLAASICRPNAVLFTYGYGFGDSHINRIIADMLTIPSTQLVVASHGPLPSLNTFKQGHYPESQTTELIGPEVGGLRGFVRLLPSTASAGLLEAQAAYAEREARLHGATTDKVSEADPPPKGGGS